MKRRVVRGGAFPSAAAAPRAGWHHPAVARSPVPCLLDCDPGHDDAIALLLALGSDALDLRAVTTVAGNGPLDRVTHNARRVLTLAGVADVPVAAGAAAPLAGPLVTAPDVHGESALDGAELPEPAVQLDPRSATELIAVTATAAEPLTLIATGPLTNVAIALDAAPGLAARLRDIVWMGGSTGRGNVTPLAEFNAHVDPEAVDRVLGSGVPFTMVGLNLTHQALATPAVVDRLRAVGRGIGDAVAGWLAFFARTYRDVHGFAAPPVHDPCAAALVADPGVIRCEEAFVAVELDGRWTRGATVVDLRGGLGRPANARVAVELDVERFWDLVVRGVSSLAR
jgi:inosine-uridine nucleoside N-ribohydrolase